MPRTLPWLKDQAPTKSRSSAAPPAKRLQPPTPESEDGDNARSAQRARREQRREAAKRAGRTPSTSPPPAPPAVEYIRPGLSADDIYIMVEDEFLSTASLYTSHLHHAEYIRLKNLAKARAHTSSSLPNTKLTAVEQVRWTDGKTGMRLETKQKRRLEGREEQNEEAIEGMRREARGAVGGSESDSNEEGDEDEEEEEGINAPWAGTSLHKLMAPVAKKNLTSLTGLQGIQSHTRAAKGYLKPEQVSQRSIFHATPKKKKKVEAPRAEKKVGFSTSSKIPQSSKRRSSISSSSSSSRASLDLDAPPPPSKPSRAPTSKITKPADPLTLAAGDLFHSTQPPLPPSKHPSHIMKPDPSPPKPSRHQQSTLDSDDEATAARRRLQMRRERAAAEAKKKENEMRMDVKGNVNEIPVFLV
ncbi:MAG: hypothetical protein Q9218_007296 [Villophora microphyllina]